MNIFRHSKEHPFHLSVGALLINDEGKICCHCYSLELLQKLDAGFETDMRTLMRETPEEGESLADAVHRGLREEFGATGEIVHCIGSTAHTAYSDLRDRNTHFDKTTVYFLVRLETIDESLREDTIEGESALQWHTPHDILDIFKQQTVSGVTYHGDEEQIVENYITQYVS